MSEPRQQRPPKYRNDHWRGATLYTQHSRVPLLWTPDPEHSPILRMLRSGEELFVVPEVKYSHWVIARVGHQVGWLDLNNVQLVERPTQPKLTTDHFNPPPQDPAPEPQPAKPRQDDEDTVASRPKELDARLLEREQRTKDLTDALQNIDMDDDDDPTPQAADASSDITAQLQHELDEMEALPQKLEAYADKDDTVNLPMRDVKRLIGYLSGIRNILSKSDKD